MSEVRRTARRVRLPGIEVTYESATGERQQARVVDMSKDGLFIPSARPPAVGKRLSLEIQPIGEPTAWSALGRVVWVRDVDEGDARPAGMAVKIIDADDVVVAAIGRLLEAREPTERGLGFGDTILPVRPRVRSSPPAGDKTTLGVEADAASAAAPPILIAAPGREPILVEVESPAPEPAHTARKNQPAGPTAKSPRARKPKPPFGRRPVAALILFVLVVVGGVAGYGFRDRILAFSRVAAERITRSSL